MGDEHFFRAPAVEHPRRLGAVRLTGQDLGLRRVGLEEVDVRQPGPFLLPVVEGHGMVGLDAPQETLGVHGDLALLRRRREHGTVEVAPDQARELPDPGLHVGQVLGAEGIAHAQGRALPAVHIGGEVLVADGAGAGRWDYVHVRAGSGEAVPDVGVVGTELHAHGGPCAAAGGGEARRHHRAAHFPDLVSLPVDVDVQGRGPRDQDVILLQDVLLLDVWIYVYRPATADCPVGKGAGFGQLTR